MKPEDQRIAIAEACGWKDIQEVPTGLIGYNETIKPNTRIEDNWVTQTVGKKYYRIPDYLNDLNAMHEAEKIIINWWAYSDNLREITDTNKPHDQDLIRASASQRAEAFLKCLGLWK